MKFPTVIFHYIGYFIESKSSFYMGFKKQVIKTCNWFIWSDYFINLPFKAGFVALLNINE